MKTTAERYKSTWDYIPKNVQRTQAKHMLENAKEFIIHEINSLVIFKMTAHYEVINKESLVVKFFDTEKESLDYCLDRFSGSKNTKQLSML